VTAGGGDVAGAAELEDRDGEVAQGVPEIAASISSRASSGFRPAEA
jgi:hypothetical protein